MGTLAEPIPSHTTISLGIAIKLDSKFYDAYRGLGATNLAIGELEEAATHYQRALDLNPDSAEALANFARMQYMAGKLDEAQENYRVALKINPESAMAL